MSAKPFSTKRCTHDDWQCCANCRPDPPDPFNQPAKRRQIGGNHYLGMNVQPWDVVDCWPREQRIGYYRGGALKYLMRMGSKDESPQEIAKGQHYMEKLLEVLRESD